MTVIQERGSRDGGNKLQEVGNVLQKRLCPPSVKSSFNVKRLKGIKGKSAARCQTTQEIQEEDDEGEDESNELVDEFYRKELELYKKWAEVEKEILPKQYWRNERATLLQTTLCPECFDDQPLEEYLRLCYLIKLNQPYEVRTLAQDKGITAATALRKNGDTILHVCAEYGQTKLFDYFYANLGGDLDMQNKLGETPFISAAREGRILILKLYYDKYGFGSFYPDARTVDGWTAFSYACLNGFLNTVQYLSSKRVNIHTSDRTKRTSLHWAARFDNTVIVELLLKLSLNPMALDYESMTP